MILSIDHGNAMMKTIHTAFASGFVQSKTPPPLQDELLTFEETYYSLTSRRFPYMWDKTADEKFFVLTLYAIAKELTAMRHPSTSVITDLAVGLPLNHYGRLKEAMQGYLRRPEPIRFGYQGREYKVQIKQVQVFPQGFAAAAANLERIRPLSGAYLIDIGGYTTDALFLRYGRADLQTRLSLENGVITLMNLVKNSVMSEYGLKLEDGHVTDALMGRQTALSNDVTASIRLQARGHAEQILHELREQGVDLTANTAVFTGGGAMQFKRLLQDSGLLRNPIFLDDLHANAKGYQLLAEEALRRRGV